MLPPKRVRPKMGIDKGPKRDWPKHEKFVRSFACCVPGCLQPSVFAHQRTAANSGKGIRPFAWFGVPLCDDHHMEQHRGVKSFERKYQIDLMAIAAELARVSTDTAMKEAMRSLESEAA